MNTRAVVQYSTEPCWSRRCSIESILSIQGKETDFVRDTSDTSELESLSDECDVEYEPCSAPEDDPPALGDSSGESDNEIIATKVIEVSVGDDGDLEFADSELTATDGSDSELDLCDYGRCAQCAGHNDNPLYRYCERCFKVRKNFFPPRPKRKHKRKLLEPDTSRPFSQDSGICSQDFERVAQDIKEPVPGSSGSNLQVSKTDRLSERSRQMKRRAESADRHSKRVKVESNSDSDSDLDTEMNVEVKPLVKTISDPSITIEDVKISKKVINNDMKEKIDTDNNMCIICLTEPKSGVFAHGRIAHICCCYKCAVKVWAKAKRCPVCNCRVSNVLKAVTM